MVIKWPNIIHNKSIRKNNANQYVLFNSYNILSVAFFSDIIIFFFLIF